MGGETIDKSIVLRWITFEDGEPVLKTNHTGEDCQLQPLMEIVHRLDELTRTDRWVTVQELVTQLDSGHNATQKMTKDLGYHKSVNKVSTLVADIWFKGEKCGSHLGTAGSILKSMKAFFFRGDKWWNMDNLYDPEIKTQSL